MKICPNCGGELSQLSESHYGCVSCGYNETPSPTSNARQAKKGKEFVSPPQKKVDSKKKWYVVRVNKRKLIIASSLIFAVFALLLTYYFKASLFYGRLELDDLGLKLQVTRYSDINFKEVFTKDELSDGIKTSAYDLVLVASTDIKKKLSIKPYKITIDVLVKPVGGEKGFCGRSIVYIYDGSGFNIIFLKDACLNLYEYTKAFRPYDDNIEYKTRINDITVQWTRHTEREYTYESR